MKESNTVGSRIAIARKRLGHNQSALARLIGVTAQCVQRWERCGSIPRGRNLTKLSEVLQVSAQYLQFGTAQNNTEITGTLNEYKAAFYMSKDFEKDYLASIERLIASGTEMGWLHKSLKLKVKSLADFGLLTLRTNSR